MKTLRELARENVTQLPPFVMADLVERIDQALFKETANSKRKEVVFVAVKGFMYDVAGSAFTGDAQQDALWYRLLIQTADQAYAAMMTRKTEEDAEASYLPICQYAALRVLIEKSVADMASLKIAEQLRGC